MSTRWAPTFGSRIEAEGARLRVCAPEARRVTAITDDGRSWPLARANDEEFEGVMPGAAAGTRYRLQRDDGPLWPDPCSRWQPDGVHGSSMLVDPDAFLWSDDGWSGVPRSRLVIYELHVGTFTGEGTFAAATTRLDDLAALGVTAIELMPVAAFPGRWNWGYDGAALFAPSERYGHPDDLRVLVDRAHALGLAVLLDVVYNHLGPDGAYLAAWMPTIFSDRKESPWGRAINLDGPGSERVRRLLCDNALHWLHEYHMDGLRLDATHALHDDSPEHFLAQLSREVAASIAGREIHLIAEDERNLARMVRPVAEGGLGMTGVWADDFHHSMRRHLAGDNEAWFTDFEGSAAEVATAVRDGWVFSGQVASHYGGPRGTSPADVSIEAAVICLQNHDQVGNRAHGDRLHHHVTPAAWLAAVTLLLTAPETPLLFMGQEWAASTPFLFFTDHDGPLGMAVVEGRRREFGRFSAFADEDARLAIPDPQAETTRGASVLRWEERTEPHHASALAATRALLAIRREHLGETRDRTLVACEPLSDDSLWLAQPSARGGDLITVVDFMGTATRVVPRPMAPPGAVPHVLFHSAALTHAPTEVHIADDSLVLAPCGTPYALVIHLPGAAS